MCCFSQSNIKAVEVAKFLAHAQLAQIARNENVDVNLTSHKHGRSCKTMPDDVEVSSKGNVIKA
jgi:hypothetical protein